VPQITTPADTTEGLMELMELPRIVTILADGLAPRALWAITSGFNRAELITGAASAGELMFGQSTGFSRSDGPSGFVSGRCILDGRNTDVFPTRNSTVLKNDFYALLREVPTVARWLIESNRSNAGSTYVCDPMEH
jgi:hypothetical protein